MDKHTCTHMSTHILTFPHTQNKKKKRPYNLKKEKSIWINLEVQAVEKWTKKLTWGRLGGNPRTNSTGALPVDFLVSREGGRDEHRYYQSTDCREGAHCPTRFSPPTRTPLNPTRNQRESPDGHSRAQDLMHGYRACVCICVPCVYLVFTEVRKGCQITWHWS